MITDNIRQAIHHTILDGTTNAEELMIAVVESGLIEENHPELHDEHGNFDQALDAEIQAAIMQEILRQLAA